MPIFEIRKPKKKFSFYVEIDTIDYVNETLQLAKKHEGIQVNLDETLQKDLLRHIEKLRDALEPFEREYPLKSQSNGKTAEPDKSRDSSAEALS